jgi:hypothetical protein
MAHQPSLDRDGDAQEQKTWPEIKDYFPACQEFWRLHIVPLRSRNSIHLRSGLPQSLERLAMNHYTCYVALAQAFRIGSGDPEEAEPVYVQLQRAAENGIAVIQFFRTICKECSGQQPSIQTGALERILDRLKTYRNFIHEGAVGMKWHSESGKVQVLKPEMMTAYTTWSSIRSVREQDLVPLAQQFWGDFMALCSALRSCWSDMIAWSNRLSKSPKYRAMQKAGTNYAGASYPSSFPRARSSVQ